MKMYKTLSSCAYQKIKKSLSFAVKLSIHMKINPFKYKLHSKIMIFDFVLKMKIETKIEKLKSILNFESFKTCRI